MFVKCVFGVLRLVCIYVHINACLDFWFLCQLYSTYTQLFRDSSILFYFFLFLLEEFYQSTLHLGVYLSTQRGVLAFFSRSSFGFQLTAC